MEHRYEIWMQEKYIGDSVIAKKTAGHFLEL